MKYKFECFHSSGTACILYKQDEDGNKSIFNLMISPLKDGDPLTIQLYIDNEQIKRKNKYWFGYSDLQVPDVYTELETWRSGSGLEFELESTEKVRHLIDNKLRVGEYTTATEFGGELGVEGMGKVKGKHTHRKQVKSK